MGQAHCAIGFIDMLSACAARPVGVGADVGGVDLDLDGVVYVGEEPVPGAAETVGWLAREGGRIDAREGGGTLAYVGELSNRNLGTIANFAFGALRSLKYDDLTIILNGDLDGEMVTDIRFGGVGQGEGATRNFLTNQVAKLPLVFNVKITAPFRQLLTSAKGFYDPSLLIEQNLPALMRAQEEAESAARGEDAPVQPPESEPVR